jgi:hypothetical protein
MNVSDRQKSALNNLENSGSFQDPNRREVKRQNFHPTVGPNKGMILKEHNWLVTGREKFVFLFFREFMKSSNFLVNSCIHS